jgi:hypothetical protein
MILQLPPGSPPLLRAVAGAILVLHIGAASLALASGASSMVFRKGGRWHRLAGDLFVVSMLIMSAIGAGAAPFLPTPQWSSTGAGLFTFYLVCTGWATARRGRNGVGGIEIVGAVAALAVAAGFAGLAWAGARGPNGSLDVASLIFGALAAFGSACDLKVILRRGVTGAARVARHLWRMTLAFFIAAASFFLGQPKVFPPGLRGSPILLAPEIIILGLMAFWLLRTWQAGRRAGGGQVQLHETARGTA